MGHATYLLDDERLRERVSEGVLRAVYARGVEDKHLRVGAAPRGFIVFGARRRVAQEGRLILTMDGRGVEVPGAPDMVIPRAGTSRNGH